VKTQWWPSHNQKKNQYFIKRRDLDQSHELWQSSTSWPQLIGGTCIPCSEMLSLNNRCGNERSGGTLSWNEFKGNLKHNEKITWIERIVQYQTKSNLLLSTHCLINWYKINFPIVFESKVFFYSFYVVATFEWFHSMVGWIKSKKTDCFIASSYDSEPCKICFSLLCWPNINLIGNQTPFFVQTPSSFIIQKTYIWSNPLVTKLAF